MCRAHCFETFDAMAVTTPTAIAHARQRYCADFDLNCDKAFFEGYPETSRSRSNPLR